MAIQLLCNLKATSACNCLRATWKVELAPGPAVSFVRREAISHFVDGADDLNTARCIFSTSTTPKLVRAARGVAMQHSWQQTDVYLVSWVQGVHDQPAAQCTALAVAIYDPHDALDLTISTRTARADTTRWVASAHANVHAPEG